MKNLILGAGLALPAILWAQATDSSQIQLAEVSVTETKILQKSGPSSATTAAVDALRIRRIAATNTADLLTASGAAFMQKSQGGGGSPVLRGLESNKVLIVVDGVRMNNAIFRGGHLQNVLRIDPNALERVEVAYGPTSVMFGSDALGGTMYFTTKGPKLGAKSLNFLARAASATGDRVVHADAQYGGTNWAAFTSISRSQFGDIVQGANRRHGFTDFGTFPNYVVRGASGDSVVQNANPNRQVGTSYEQVDAIQKVFWVNGRTTHLVNLQHSQTGNVNRYDRLTERSNGLPKFAEWYYGPEVRSMASYRLEHQSNDTWYDKVVLTAAYQELRESRNSRKLNATNLKSQRERVQAESATIDFYRTRKSQHLQVGAEAYWNQVTSVADLTPVGGGSVTPTDTRYPDGGAQTVMAGLYVQNRVFTESSKWAYHYGARLNANRLNAQFTDQATFALPVDKANQRYASLSWNAGASRAVTSSDKVVINVSNGFRAPNVDDLSKVFESANGKLILPNADLGPEKATQAEVKWVHSSNKWAAQLGGYATLLSDVIGLQFTEDSLDFNGERWGIYQSANLDRGLIRGIFAQAEVNVTPAIKAQSQINLQKGSLKSVDGTSGPLDHIPPVFGQSSVRWTSDRIAVECWVQYAGAKLLENYRLGAEDNEQYATSMGMPGWTTLNLRADWTISKGWSAQLAANNLFDVNYRYFASGVSAPGRNVQLSIRASF
ncbi:MAG: TonB-dependent receptor [Bacteroidota bacterium]